MADNIETKRDAATGALRDLVGTLEAREAELSAELATVQAQRKDAAKLLASLTGEAPKRRRGRPKRAAVEAVAA